MAPASVSSLALASLLMLVVCDAQCSEDEASCKAGSRYILKDGKTALDLVQVIVVHRHGDRAPITKSAGSFVQTDELKSIWSSKINGHESIRRWGVSNRDDTGTYITHNISSSSSWPFGQLTKRGAAQMRRVGAELRERYVGDLGFLPGDLPADHSEEKFFIYVRSTRYPRTVQSVQNLLLGLYPEDTRLEASGAAGVIAIESKEKAVDHMTGLSDKRCPRVKSLLSEMDRTIRPGEKHVQLLEELAVQINHTETEEDKMLIDIWIHLADLCHCHRSHGMSIPFGLTPSQVDALIDYNTWLWSSRMNLPQLGRLAIGGFLQDILRELKATVAGNPRAKLLVFSGHDSTLFPLLKALQAFDEKWPPYASRVQLELLQEVETGAFYLRLLYNNQLRHMLGSSEEFLPIEEFFSKLTSMEAADIHEECLMAQGQ